jgi:hypothetical protein
MFYRPKVNPDVVINLAKANSVRIHKFHEAPCEVHVSYNAESQKIFCGTYEECSLLLDQIVNRMTFAATVSMN